MTTADEDVEMLFALRLKEAREAKGLTQVQLGRALGIGSATVSRWESTHRGPEHGSEGRSRNPPLPQLARIGRTLEVSVDWLLGLPGGYAPARAELSPRAQRILVATVRKLEAVSGAVEELASLVEPGTKPKAGGQ